MAESAGGNRRERGVERHRLGIGVAAVLVLAAVTGVALFGVASGSSSRPLAAASGSTAPPSTAPPSTAPPSTAPPSTAPVITQGPGPSVPVFDKRARSIDDPASIWVVSDKRRPLNPVDYAPVDLVYPDVAYVNRQPLRHDAATALATMFAAGGSEAGLAFQVQSAYRSYATQVSVYNGWVARLGQAAADLTSARPGTSEHQTGLAADISSVPTVCPVEKCFGDTPQAKWLAANAWRFGFILRYPAGKTAVTGYEYEPYHFRYVGMDLATEMHTTGVSTLEEFFGLPAAPDYG